MDPVIWDWLNFTVRWVHVITAIAWIGSSFYFNALDLGLRKRENLPQGVGGEEWQVHGGGFYHIQKYMVAPEATPEHLTWFKWESYATWLSGFALLFVVYYAGAELFLIDRNVLDVPAWVAIAISLAGLAAGWIVYHLMCRSPIGKNEKLLFACLFGFFVLATWGFTLAFSGRGALVHSGAVIATIMTANVFFVIIPNQRKVVHALLAGEEPDPALGREAKQRSTHNNYLTLPVLFLMLSIHSPLAFGTRWNWAIVALVLVIGVVVRHFFNTFHARKGRPWWTWGVAALCIVVIVWLSTFPPPSQHDTAAAGESPEQREMLASEEFDEVRNIVLGRCSMCHAREPLWEGIAAPPRGVHLESDEDILRQADQIYLQVVRSHAMPPGNITEVTAGERQHLAAWYEAFAETR